jgi:hypothetical protein
MKLKLDEAGHVVVADGKPVYVHEDGKEIPFDAAQTVATIARLNGEAKKHREGKETAEASLKAFEGIEDAAAARRALETVKNLDQKKLVDAGEVEKVKAEAVKAMEDRIKSVEEKYAPVMAERDQLQNALHAEKVGGSFARSKVIADKLAIPADLVQAKFGHSFKVEGNDVVAYDGAGNKLYSRAKPGEVAAFDEALEMLIDQYPHRDSILKGSGASGSGAQGGGQGGSRTITRAQLDQMDPLKKAETARAAGKGEVQLVD